MNIRAYRKDDAPALCQLFYETVHKIGRGAYTPEQLAAWAPRVPDADPWHKRMIGRFTWVAEDESGLTGFLELERNGHLDMLYCRADRVRRGVGTALYAAAETQARQLGIRRLYAEASRAARPFFTRQGFVELAERTVERETLEGARVRLTNHDMEKVLGPLR